jgi:hypothetical protein
MQSQLLGTLVLIWKNPSGGLQLTRGNAAAFKGQHVACLGGLNSMEGLLQSCCDTQLANRPNPKAFQGLAWPNGIKKKKGIHASF